MIYQWTSGCRLDRYDAQAIGERLETLRRTKGGLTPRIVVADAFDKTAPHHSIFEWNDTAAAIAYREDQASHLLRSIVVTMTGGAESSIVTRAFVSVSGGEGDGRYESTEVVMASAVLRAQVLDRALREFKALERKYDGLEELAGVFAAIEEAAGRVAR